MNDRTIGYICIIFSAIIVVILTLFFISKFNSPQEVRIIEFPDIDGLSFINIDDPVTLKGMIVGKVLSTELRNQRIFVRVLSSHHINIYKDYQVAIGAQGIMGDRFLNIEPGQPSKSILPNKQILKGTILPSPPEAVSDMEVLISAIRELNAISEVLLNGDSTKESFVSFFENLIKKTDSVSSTISINSQKALIGIPATLDTLNDLLAQCISLKNSLSEHIPSSIDTIQTMLATGLVRVQEVDSLLMKTIHIVKNYNNLDLSTLDKSIEDAHNGLCSLNVLLHNIKGNGLSFQINLQ
jgi:phospholipid/cholesterol/gamma-HCH transport system substrate-binding protein